MPSKLWMLLLLAFAPLAIPQSNSLPSKETLTYNIEWRLITAGKAKVEFTSQPRSNSQVNVHLESVGLVSKLFKVEDDYAALFTGGQSLCAQSVQMTANEGSRKRDTRITFDAESRKAAYLERDRVKNSVLLQQEIDISPCVHDVVGGLYFLRTLNLEPNQNTSIAVSDGKKNAMVKVETAPQREDVKTPAGTFKTLRYEVYLFNNVIYRRPAHLTVWLADDRKLPVQLRVRLQFTIGTITLQLEKHE